MTWNCFSLVLLLLVPITLVSAQEEVFIPNDNALLRKFANIIEEEHEAKEELKKSISSKHKTKTEMQQDSPMNAQITKDQVINELNEDPTEKSRPETTTDFKTLVAGLQLLTSGLLSNVRAIISEKRRQRSMVPYAGYVRFGKRSPYVRFNKRSQPPKSVEDSMFLQKLNEILKEEDKVIDSIPLFGKTKSPESQIEKKFDQFMKQKARDEHLIMQARRFGQIKNEKKIVKLGDDFDDTHRFGKIRNDKQESTNNLENNIRQIKEGLNAKTIETEMKNLHNLLLHCHSQMQIILPHEIPKVTLGNQPKNMINTLHSRPRPLVSSQTWLLSTLKTAVPIQSTVSKRTGTIDGSDHLLQKYINKRLGTPNYGPQTVITNLKTDLVNCMDNKQKRRQTPMEFLRFGK